MSAALLPLPPAAADRFGKLLGLLGSDQLGERAAAAAKATAVLHEHKLAWFDVAEALKRPPAVSRPRRSRASAKPDRQAAAHQHRASLLLLSGYGWNDWERSFLASMQAWRSSLTEKQQDILNEMEVKAAAWVASKGGAR